MTRSPFKVHSNQQMMNHLRTINIIRSHSGLLHRQHVRHFSYTESIAGAWTALSKSAPVACLQDGLIQLHDATGLPWWATIVMSTFALRTVVTLPLAVYQAKNMAKFEKVVTIDLPEISRQLKQETAIAVRKFNWTEEEARKAFTASVGFARWLSVNLLILFHTFSAAGSIFEVDCERELPSGQVDGHFVGTNTAVDHPIGDH